MKMFLIDDGTLDTVFQCEKCGKWERYSHDGDIGIERDSIGQVTPEEMARVENEHTCEE